MDASGYTPQGLVPRTRAALQARGARPVAGELARWALRAAGGLPWTVAGRRGTFTFQGQRYPYLFHRHKLTWLTERAVEVPVVQALVDEASAAGVGDRGARVLEVGNVLAHYRPQAHLVVDRYERAAGVLNRDVLELGDLGPFDLIVAVSTLEHVGFDEEPRDPGKPARAVAALRAQLAPGGRLVLTVPAGYNPAFDTALRTGAIPVDGLAALRHAGGAARWREVAPSAAWDAPYDFLAYRARAVVFAVITNPAVGRA